MGNYQRDRNVVCSFRLSNGRKGIVEDAIDLFQSGRGKKEQRRKRVINQPHYTQKTEIIIIILI